MNGLDRKRRVMYGKVGLSSRYGVLERSKMERIATIGDSEDEKIIGGFQYFLAYFWRNIPISNTGETKSSVRFMPPPSCDRYKPRDKRRITGIKQLPRSAARQL